MIYGHAKQPSKDVRELGRFGEQILSGYLLSHIIKVAMAFMLKFCPTTAISEWGQGRERGQAVLRVSPSCCLCFWRNCGLCVYYFFCMSMAHTLSDPLTTLRKVIFYIFSPITSKPSLKTDMESLSSSLYMKIINTWRFKIC